MMRQPEDRPSAATPSSRSARRLRHPLSEPAASTTTAERHNLTGMSQTYPDAQSDQMLQKTLTTDSAEGPQARRCRARQERPSRRGSAVRNGPGRRALIRLGLLAALALAGGCAGQRGTVAIDPAAAGPARQYRYWSQPRAPRSQARRSSAWAGAAQLCAVRRLGSARAGAGLGHLAGPRCRPAHRICHARSRAPARRGGVRGRDRPRARRARA